MRKLIAPLVIAIALAAPAALPVRAQEHAPAVGGAAQPEGEHAAADAEHAAEEHGVLAGLLWPTLNFLILCGGLYYFLAAPFAAYVAGRRSTIRQELVDATATRAQATKDIADIDRKLAALPREIEALRTRGADEIAAEEQRIAGQAARERERLVEQVRQEIDLHVRVAKRELVEHAADLAVQLAHERLQREITPDDQARLVGRYLDQVKKA